jgi:hypothetical protein
MQRQSLHASSPLLGIGSAEQTSNLLYRLLEEENILSFIQYSGKASIEWSDEEQKGKLETNLYVKF